MAFVVPIMESTFSVIAKEKGKNDKHLRLYGIAITSRASLHVSTCIHVDHHRRFVMVAQMEVKEIGPDLSKKLDSMGDLDVPGKVIVEEMKKLIYVQPLREHRQYAIITFDDEYFQFTGNACCFDRRLPNTTQGNQVMGAGQENKRARFLVAVQANIVAQDVLIEMLHGFQEEPLGPIYKEDAQHEDMQLRSSLLGLRLLSALRAGQRAGGDMRHWPQDSMNPTYNSAAFVLVPPRADPVWVFYPGGKIAGVDGKWFPYNHSKKEDLEDTGVTLDKLHEGYLNRVKPTLESRGLYELATTPRWPWVPHNLNADALRATLHKSFVIPSEWLTLSAPINLLCLLAVLVSCVAGACFMAVWNRLCTASAGRLNKAYGTMP